MRIENITSAQNTKIKDLLVLQEKSKERRKKGLFVVEGRRELLHCIEVGYEPHTVFICTEILTQEELLSEVKRVFDKMRGKRWICCTSHFVQKHCSVADLTAAYDLVYQLARG